MEEARVSVALFATMTCRHDAAPKLAAALDNAALSEIPICRLPVGQVPMAKVALQAAPLVNVVLFKTPTDKHTAGPRLAVVKVNADSSATMTCRLCVAQKLAVALVNADLFETPICKLPVAQKPDKPKTR